jgi:hypothetical protein
VPIVLKDVPGALSDYAGNHGDLTPGAVGKPTDFYFGGNGTGVIISVRPSAGILFSTMPAAASRLSTSAVPMERRSTIVN